MNIRVNPEVIWREVDDELVMCSLDQGFYYSLNSTGVTVWKGLDAGKPIEAIANEIAEEYSIDPDLALRDVSDLVSEMTRLGVLLPKEPESA